MEEKTLKDVMPEVLSEIDGSYCETQAFEMVNIKVIAEHGSLIDDNPKKWPGSHKNVYFWAELGNGYAVGWNENPVRGWSFPVFKIK